MSQLIKKRKIEYLSEPENSLLTYSFLNQYPDFPVHMNAIGKFVFLRTYSRYLPLLKRRETYKEVCQRASEYNIGLSITHLKSIGYKIDTKATRAECQLLFDNMFNLRQFLSGRTLFIGGTKAAEKSRCGNFNCFADGTPINLSQGVSISIENMKKYKADILSWNNKQGLVKAQVSEYFDQGFKECYEILLNDGRTIQCTEDHRLMTNDGKWLETKNIKIGETRLKVGVDYPKADDLFDNYSNIIKVGEFTFDLSILESKIKAMTFFRLFGLFLTDGSQYNVNIDDKKVLRTDLFIGHQIDLDNVVNDINLLVGHIPSHQLQENCWRVIIPVKIGRAFNELVGEEGKRINKEMKLPECIKSIPKFLLREFIGGMFGGDGTAPTLNKTNKQITGLGIVISKLSEYVYSAIDGWNLIAKLLKDNFDISSAISHPSETTTSKKQNLQNDEKKYTVKLNITSYEDLLKFNDQIGFRYCCHKSQRLSCAASWARFRYKFIQQKDWITQRVNEISGWYEKKQGNINKQHMSIIKAYKQAKNEFMNKEIPLHPKIFPKEFSAFRIHKFYEGSQKHLPQCENNKPAQYFSDNGMLEYFWNKDISGKGNCVYAVNENSNSLPTFSLLVIGIKNVGIKKVNDIQVDNFSNFMANGIVSHNCAFLNISSWSDLGDLFYMLLVGTGVGFKCTKALAKQIPKIRVNTILMHSKYQPLPANQRIEDTDVHIFKNGYAKIFIGDSKEGWVNSLRKYFELLTNPEYEFIHTIKISYNSIRPHGERLKTFGGQASGPDPIREMYEGIDNVFKNKIDSCLDPIIVDEKGYGNIRPIHILDIGNLIGNNVVVGGVRRTAEINLFDHDDHEVLLSKYGINGFWTNEHIENHKKIGNKLELLNIKPSWFDDLSEIGKSRQGINHRRMSNNSIAFTSKPTKEFMELVFLIMRAEGEPGFFNFEAANKRRPNCEGVNPCLTGDTMITTSDGLQSIKSLVGKQFNAIVEGKEYSSTEKGFWSNGLKQVFKITLKNGQTIKATDNHRFYIQVDNKKKINDWKEVKNMKVGDKMVLSNNKDYKWNTNNGTFEEGYFVGQLIGDGTFDRSKNIDQPCIDLWIPIEYDLQTYNPARMISEWAETLNKRSDAIGFTKQVHKGPGYQKYRMKLAAFRDIAERFNIFPLEKKIYEKGSYEFTKGMLRGFFDADGCVIGNHKKGCSVRLPQTELSRLEAVQRLLLCMGIYSTIYKNRLNGKKKKLMPDGKGGRKEYECQDYHELCISKDQIILFADVIGFSDNDKSANLTTLISQYKRKPYLTKFETEILSISEEEGEEEVYDCTINDIHAFIANGLISHNCGEIILDSYGLCNLTTVNLVQFVKDGENGKYLDTEALFEAQKLSARCGLRMTLITLELPHWDVVQKRDRLLGTSLTGIKDAMDMLNYSADDEYKLMTELKRIARTEADRYSYELRINCPLLVTTLKPEGCSRKDMLITTSRGLLTLEELGKVANDVVLPEVSNEIKENESVEPHCPYCFKIFSRRDAIKRHLSHCFELKCIKYAETLQSQLNKSKDIINEQDSIIRKLQKGNDVKHEIETHILVEEKIFKDMPKGIYAPGDNGKLNNVTKFYVNGKVPTKLIITSDGNELESSLNHRFRVVTDSGNYEWKQVRDLQIGDKLVVKLGTHPDDLKSILKKINYQLSNGHRIEIKQPDELTEDIAFFLGMFYGDGSVHQKGIRISCNSKQSGQIGWIVNFIKNTFGLECYVDNTSMKTATSVQISSLEIIDWLKLNGCLKEYSYELEVPYLIRTASKENVIAFINGFWRADGEIHSSGNSWSICSVSERFARNLFALCRSVGYNVKLTQAGPSKGAYGTRDRWIIQIRKLNEDNKDRYRSKTMRERVWNEFWLDPIQNITDSECETFDIEVEESHHYLMNGGTVSHNTLSQIAGGVSSGLHLSHSPFYIRRIRINAADPLAKAVQALGWNINPEVGTPGLTYDEKMKNARTLVIDFPIASGINKTKFDTNVVEQLNIYFNYQKQYTEHNSSNTITVRPEEWDTARDIIYNNWDDFIGVSFLQLDGHTYSLAPYEACDEKTYLELKNSMKDFDMNYLIKYENEHEFIHTVGGREDKNEDKDESMEIIMDSTVESCAGGACSIR